MQDTQPKQQDQTQGHSPEEDQNQDGQVGPGKEQDQAGTSSGAPQSPESGLDDEVLAAIQAMLKGVSSPDLHTLSDIFKTTLRRQDGPPNESSPTELVELGDLDGDGVPEAALKMPVPEGSERDSEGQGPTDSLQALYLLSWDRTEWKASRLGPPTESIQFRVIRLGKNGGRAIAVVSLVGEEAAPYPAIFQVREHEAAMVWDSQAGNALYTALEHGQIEFQDDAKLEQTDLIESGRADPGLLQCERGGRRGFNTRFVYHWDGQAYVPVRTEYTAGPDYTLYRFIAALHLRDFRNAYSLTDPGQFLKTEEPSLEKFRKLIEESWPEFLDDRIFQAREAGAGSADALAFELPEMHYVYRPKLSQDGKFLLTGLERTVETAGPDSN